MTNRSKVEAIESELANQYSEMLSKGDIVLFEQEDLEDGDTPDDYYEYRNDITGNVIDVHIIKVDNDGIHTIESDDSEKTQVIKFSDLGSVLDRISLLERMFDNRKWKVGDKIEVELTEWNLTIEKVSDKVTEITFSHLIEHCERTYDLPDNIGSVDRDEDRLTFFGDKFAYYVNLEDGNIIGDIFDGEEHIDSFACFNVYDNN